MREESWFLEFLPLDIKLSSWFLDAKKERNSNFSFLDAKSVLSTDSGRYCPEQHLRPQTAVPLPQSLTYSSAQLSPSKNQNPVRTKLPIKSCRDWEAHMWLPMGWNPWSSGLGYRGVVPKSCANQWPWVTNQWERDSIGNKWYWEHWWFGEKIK